jgi:protein involved in temperature-dependent protein secretion
LQNPSSLVIPGRARGLSEPRASEESAFEIRNPKLETSRKYDLNLYEKSGQLGWLTTAANRPQIIANFAATLATESRLFNSAVLLEECRTFVRHENGSASAAAGAHDDAVMAIAIALAARNELAQNQDYQRFLGVNKNPESFISSQP